MIGNSFGGIRRFFIEEDNVPRWVIFLLSFWVLVFGVLLLAGVDCSV